MISKLKNPDVIQFIQENLKEDPSIIALKADKYPELPIREIASQIASRQKVVKKLPEWVENERLIFPPKENLEQASSQETAQFKASLFKGNTFLDLTGGTGIDIFYISQNFNTSIYVEPDGYLCELATHNFNELKVNIEVHHARAEDYINNTSRHFDLIYIDPSRRNDSKQRLILLEEYQPNVISMLPKLLKKGNRICIKVSPMVDIKQVIGQLECVSKVVCLAVRNEMKEILIELTNKAYEAPIIEAINITNQGLDTFSAAFSDEKKALSQIFPPSTFIYEPNSAIRKAGFFKLIGAKFGLNKLDLNTHLYTSDKLIDDFPGRIFKVLDCLKPDKKIIRKSKPGRTINVISKNYPLGTNEIKKKYQLKDGGDEFLIFCKIEALGNVVLKCISIS